MACILCEEKDFSSMGEVGGFSIVKCAGCEFVYTDPMPARDELEEFYKGPYYGTGATPAGEADGGEADEGEFKAVASRAIRKRRYDAFTRARMRVQFGWFTSRLKRAFRGTRPMRLIDIGCGQGDLLYLLRLDSDFNAIGLDLSVVPVMYCRKLGLDVKVGTLQEQSFEEESFDAVTALNLIEHVPDPVAELREMNRALVPGGLLASRVPCVTHIRARMSGINWDQFNPPRHLWYFSPETFGRLLQMTGFECVYESTFSNNPVLRVIARKK